MIPRPSTLPATPRTSTMALLTSLERLWHDLRHAVRMFVKAPGFTAIAVLSIAFGTDANVAIFSVTDAMLLRPLPILKPADLLTVGSEVKRGFALIHVASYLDYVDVRRESRAFRALAAYDYELVGIATK